MTLHKDLVMVTPYPEWDIRLNDFQEPEYIRTTIVGKKKDKVKSVMFTRQTDKELDLGLVAAYLETLFKAIAKA